MNEAPSNQTGLNDTFSSQAAPQTNPFTADLKGEFTSNFGTNTNAVSQIFKEGGFVNNSRSKYLIIGGVLVVVLAIVFFVLTSEGEQTDFKDETTTEAKDSTPADEKDDDTTAEDKAETAAAKPEEAAAEATAVSPAAVQAPVAEAAMSMGGPLSLAEPADAASVNYDETQGPAVFSWTGGGGHIIFSRNASMTPETLRVRVSGNSYKFHHPWPGTWHWKVQNDSGSSEVRSFTVSAPMRRNVQLAAPSGALSGNGGTVSWQGDLNVASYRVEISSGSWANPQFRFATTGNSVQLSGVPAGQYQMRVGAFSEVSGRWEYTSTVPVQIQ